MTIEQARERAASMTFEFHCQHYCAPSNDGKGVRREVTLEWDHETGEFGSILSSTPLFTLNPPCKGQPMTYEEANRTDDAEMEEEGFERVAHMSYGHYWHVPNRCPFHEEALEYQPPEVDAVLAVASERKAFKRLLG